MSAKELIRAVKYRFFDHFRPQRPAGLLRAVVDIDLDASDVVLKMDFMALVKRMRKVLKRLRVKRRGSGSDIARGRYSLKMLGASRVYKNYKGDINAIIREPRLIANLGKDFENPTAWRTAGKFVEQRLAKMNPEILFPEEEETSNKADAQ